MYNDNYLIHYGTIGMRWGISKRDQSSIDRAMQRDNSKIHRQNDASYSNRKKVFDKMSKEVNQAYKVKDSPILLAWNKAYKAGPSSPEWAEWDKMARDIQRKYDSSYSKAYVKDLNLGHIKNGEKYVQEKLFKDSDKTSNLDDLVGV